MIGLGFEPILLGNFNGGGAVVLPPVNTAPPSVWGTGLIGSALQGQVGTWTGGAGIAYDWAWQRDGADIAGAAGTGATVQPLTLIAADDGAQIALRVTARLGTAAATAYSVPVTPSFAGPAASTGSWKLTLGENVDMTPLDASRAFAGLSLSFDLAPASDPLPAGLSLSATGTLSGRPSPAGGPLNIVIRGTNPAGSATKTLALTIRPADFYADYVGQIFSPDGTTTTTFAALHGFTRASTATRLDPLGAIEVVAVDTPRFDHAADGAALGLMVEGATTNLLVENEGFTSPWTLFGATSTLAGLSLRGRWSGLRVASAGAQSNRIAQIISLTAGQTRRFRFWLQYGSSARGRVQIKDGASGNVTRIRGAAGALATVLSDAGAVAALSETVASDGIVELEFDFTSLAGGDHEIAIGPDSATTGEDIVILAAQTGAGSFIPAGAAAATRSADQVSLSAVTAGTYDVIATLGDDSQRRFDGSSVAAGYWPGFPGSHIKRLDGYLPGYWTLETQGGTGLARESGVALYLETPL